MTAATTRPAIFTRRIAQAAFAIAAAATLITVTSPTPASASSTAPDGPAVISGKPAAAETPAVSPSSDPALWQLNGYACRGKNSGTSGVNRTWCNLYLVADTFEKDELTGKNYTAESSTLMPLTSTPSSVLAAPLPPHPRHQAARPSWSAASLRPKSPSSRLSKLATIRCGAGWTGILTRGSSAWKTWRPTRSRH